MKAHHPESKLIAVFEPRSATACRNTHQHEYPDAFMSADLSMIAPIGRPDIPENERLDVPRIVREIGARGGRAMTVDVGPGSVDAIVAAIAAVAKPGDVVAVLSNGAFGGIHGKLTQALSSL
jgi:UDP-N-acetylmuramate: L-alanyl-gamma-D-glutamyl-meso-diaminopimelate ligase